MIGNKLTSSKWLNYCILALFVSIKFILQYAVINPAYELHRDEYLHLDQGKHLAWGFLSVPPFTSWISHIIFLLGNGIFWVKFFPALFGAMTIIVVWFAIEELHGKLFAQGIAASALVCSVMLRINILYQPNSFDIFCWTILYYFLLKYINTGSYRWLWIGAITCGIAFLNKYNIAFLFFGIIPALLLTNHRKIFLHKQLYLSILLCIAIISPNLIWQYQHNFPVYHHLKTLAATQLVNVQRFDFLKSQLIFFYNSVFILLLAFLSFFVHRVFFKFRVFFYSFVITLLLFLYLKNIFAETLMTSMQWVN